MIQHSHGSAVSMPFVFIMDSISFCSPCWPGTPHVVQAGLELIVHLSTEIKGVYYHTRYLFDLYVYVYS